jgi:hypothetical protein
MWLYKSYFNEERGMRCIPYNTTTTTYPHTCKYELERLSSNLLSKRT